MKKLLLLIPASLLTLPLFLMPLETCGCEPNPFTIARMIDIHTDSGEDVAPVEVNQRLATKAFLGKDIKSLPTNEASLDEECSFKNPREINCTYWNELGLIRSKGRHVTIVADSNGKVISVSVVQIKRGIL